MRRVQLPFLTTTEGLSVFDTDNQYRPLLWDRASSEIDWLQKQDNGLLLTILEHLPTTGKPWNEPIIHWTEDERMNPVSYLTTAVNVSETSLILADAKIAVVGTHLVSPADSEIMVVTAVDYDTSTLTVTRGANGTSAVAKAARDKIIAMPVYLPELGDIPDGMGRMAGEGQWNCISIIATSLTVGRLQENSMVYDNWGQVPQLTVQAALDIRRSLGYALIFQARATYPVANKGQMYIGSGFLHYLKDGFLDVGSENANLTWPILNAWLEARFAPDASSQQKVLLAGPNLFGALNRLARDAGKLAEGPYFHSTLAVSTMQITTESGYSVEVLLDKFGLSPDFGLADWGLLMDTAHIEGGMYNGLPFQWVQNIQDNDDLLRRRDAYIGSFAMVVKHQECHGIIRGAANKIL